MKITEFIKNELKGWKRAETVGLFCVIVFILVSSFLLKDKPVAVVSAICGILYTIIAGKGKISCYFFGLCGSGCYSLLAFNNAIWGNLILYLFYYIPMQLLGIFKWKKHLNTDTQEIYKTKLEPHEKKVLIFFCILFTVIAAFILNYFNDKSPIIDAITAVFSIAGMYLTVKRAIEQWIVWMIVNGLSFIMWLDLVCKGERAYATLIMWSVYFILAVYFYTEWKKEMDC